MSQDLYSASGVVPPSVNDVTRVANKLGLQLTQEDTLSYQKIMGKFFQGFKILDELPEPALPVKYQRTPGYRPGPEENPHNAWYYKTDIQGAAEGKLAGRTVAIKDNMAVAGVPMMIGSKIYEGYTPEFDATVVTRLLDAGARIVGKSSCEDMCFSGSSVTSTYGPVPNFHHDRHSSGGSSSGSAYLVASGEVDLAVGGDQGGSIRIPASWSGIVGLKPTYGLIPYTGAASIEATMDHLGPMARTVYDCSLMLEVMAGYDGGLDPRQPCNLQIPAYTQALNGDLGKVRVGIVKEGFEDCEEDVKSMVMEAANKLKQCGAHVDEVSIPMHKEGLTIWAAVFHEGHYNCIVECSGTTLGNRGFYATSLADTLSKGFQTKINEVSAPFKLAMLMGGYMRDRYHNHYYCKGQNLVRLLTQAYDVALHEYDVLVMPTIKFKAPHIPPADASLEDFINHCENMCDNVATFDATGHPALSINTGFSGGLPVGMMVIGKHFDETSVLKVAGAYETMRNMKQEVE